MTPVTRTEAESFGEFPTGSLIYRCAIYAAGVLLCAALAGAQAIEETLTLDRAVALAVESNLTLRNAGLEVEKARHGIAALRTQRYPSLSIYTLGSELLSRLSFQFEEGAFGDFPATGPIPDSDTRIDVARTFNVFSIAQITQPLSQLHEIGLGIRAREAALGLGQEQERAARNAVRREVKRAYFGVLQAESAVAAAEEGVRVYEEVTREMVARVAQRAALAADRLDAEARLADARAGALAASNALRTAQQQLNYLLGRDLDAPVRLAPVPIAPLPARSDTSVQSRPDVRQSQLRVQQAELDVRLAEADRIPDVALSASYLAPVNFDLLPQNVFSAGVTVSWEPFTWGRRAAEVAQKRNALEQARNAARDTELRSRIEIEARSRKVQEAAAQAEVRRLEVEAARERLRSTRVRFDQQAARPDELYGATATLAQANAREQQAVATYWNAVADYEEALGEN